MHELPWSKREQYQATESQNVSCVIALNTYECVLNTHMQVVAGRTVQSRGECDKTLAFLIPVYILNIIIY